MAEAMTEIESSRKVMTRRHRTNLTMAAPGPSPSPAPAPGVPEFPPPSDSFMKGCLHIVQAILWNSEGHHEDIGEYMTIVCAQPKSGADVSLCGDFRESLLGHMHPKDQKWNRNGMDLPLFCHGFNKIVHQHVFAHYPHKRPAAGPSGSPAPAPMVAPPPAF